MPHEEPMRGVSLINLTGFKVYLQFEYRDLWIGLFVRRNDIYFQFYIGLVPFFPIYVTVLRRAARKMKKKQHSLEGDPHGKALHRSKHVAPVLRGRGR